MNHDHQPRCRFDGARLVLVHGNLTGWCHRCGAWRQADTGGRPTQDMAEAEKEKWEHFAEMILKVAPGADGAKR